MCIRVGTPQISTRRAHHAGLHLASEDALARTDTTEQAAGVDAAAAAVGGLNISCPGGAGAATGQVLVMSPLPSCFPQLSESALPARRVRVGSNASFERAATDASHNRSRDPPETTPLYCNLTMVIYNTILKMILQYFPALY